jgi:cyclomaltodextrinase / maltogenic alpha-amylase / neopullulanase
MNTNTRGTPPYKRRQGMKIEAICHIPKSNYAYAYTDHELHIRLRTAKNDMTLVNLFYGSKFQWEKKQKQSMKKIMSDEYFDYYQTEIQVEDTRIGYYFELVSDGNVMYYTEAGMVPEFNDAMAYCYFFQYPFINSNDVHKVPSWIHDIIFYQIFVERFKNGDVENSPPDLCHWEDNPKPKSFFGGDLRGIIDELDYLQDLGINGIYLTPIFKSPSNHKYDIVNYYEIDPYFGDKDTLKELVDKAHERNIKIVLDAVFNHCSSEFPPFLDVMEKGKDSEYYEWFFIDGDKVRKDPPNYKMFGFVAYMPKLNTSNPKLREYLLDCIRYWGTEIGIDGWRLDVSDEIDHEFWREFRKTVKSINPDAIIIGENWHNALPWLMGDQFDSIMNYSVTKLCVDFYAKRIISAKAFEQRLADCLMRYPDQVNEAMLNLLDSHDTERFLYSSGENKKSLKLAAAFLFAYMGMPCTYYGTEIGMTGNYDPGCRKGFDWRKDHWDIELYEYYKKLITLRKEENSLKYGDIEFLSTDNVFAMKRTYGKEGIYCIINTTDMDQEFQISCKEYTKLNEILSEGEWELTEGTVTIKVPADTAYYIKLA